ncbi:nuclear transport factor 2 family protein [soil metagenome]
MSTLSAEVVTSSSEEQAIRQAVGYYIEGLRTGSVETLKQGFHPQAVMSGYLDETPLVTPIQGLYDFAASVPSPAQSGEPFHAEIRSIQVTGNAATIELREGPYQGHDFAGSFHLLKIEGRWWITSKLFQAV